ncbi:hypothetical protein [Bradyrhizobium monzae]|uniref:hypothetical protein n=1 Tax=Bradyrhizobium sp. Oc8 TaxID=2876780 RepID=UPI001F33DE8B|nr:hypothetical protein [Bradyrhizobium sp. Oc8]
MFGNAAAVSAPTLALNDGGTYVGGSGGAALTFNHVVAAGQNTADLVVSSLNLNGAAVTDGSGNAASLSGATNYNPAGTPADRYDGADDHDQHHSGQRQCQRYGSLSGFHPQGHND